MSTPIERAQNLSCWKTKVQPKPIDGGRTNNNFLVEYGDDKFFVRIGEDIPVHGVMRFNELAASRAAAAADVSPPVVHAETGAMVLRYIDGRTLSESDIRDTAMLEKILPLLKRSHDNIPQVLQGPALVFWVFQVIRHYAQAMREGHSRHLAKLPQLTKAAKTLEIAVGPIELRFGHNDLLADNFIDDGERLWLVDWDYAGFNSALFDLGGLASNSQLSESQQYWLLENYFGEPPSTALLQSYQAMKCASLLRETMWSMVSEIYMDIDFDYATYSTENLQRFEQAWDAFRSI